MSTPPSPSPHSPRPGDGDRALVLGGGGSTGNAWMIGVVAGLLDAGLDVTDADLIIGTSAGSTTAAQITGASPTELLGAILAAESRTPPSAAAGRDVRRAPSDAVSSQLERRRAVIAAADDLADLRRTLGAAALERAAEAEDGWQTKWRNTVAARLPSPAWPERTVRITAVDAATGDPVLFDKNSGVDLVDAVAASCSSSVAYRIRERHYVDGGFRANAENADLAAGYDRVLVLSPFGGRSLHPPEWGTHLAAQIEELEAGGSSVETIVPASTSEHLFGANAMNIALTPAAARAGHEQGNALAERLTGFWR